MFKTLKNVFTKKYLIVYLLYFLLFLTVGSLDTLIPLLTNYYNLDVKIFGYILSIVSFAEVILPVFVGTMSLKYDPLKISLIGFLVGAIAAFFIGFTSSIIMVFVALVLLSLVRTTFNYSFGNTLNYIAAREDRSKYFASRDIFLFSGVSLSLLLFGAVTKFSKINVAFIGIGALFIGLQFFTPYVHSKWKENIVVPGIEKKTWIYNIRTLVTNKVFVGFALVKCGNAIYKVSLAFLPLLALQRGFNYSNILVLFGSFSFINSLIAFFFSNIADNSDRKVFYVIDIAIDIVPALLLSFSSSNIVFLIGFIIVFLKDVFAPISFSYFYDCFSEKDSSFYLGALESFSSILVVIFPIIISILWEIDPRLVFVVGAIGIAIATFAAIKFLPSAKACREIENIV